MPASVRTTSPANSRCVTNCMLSAIAGPTGVLRTKLSAAVIFISAFYRRRRHRVAATAIVEVADFVVAALGGRRGTGIVGADFPDQAALRKDVPLIAAQVHALLRLEVRPFEHGLEPRRIDQDAIDRPDGAEVRDRGDPALRDRLRADERALRRAGGEIVHAVGLETRGDLAGVRFVAGVEILADRRLESGSGGVAHRDLLESGSAPGSLASSLVGNRGLAG